MPTEERIRERKKWRVVPDGAERSSRNKSWDVSVGFRNWEISCRILSHTLWVLKWIKGLDHIGWARYWLEVLKDEEICKMLMFSFEIGGKAFWVNAWTYEGSVIGKQRRKSLSQDESILRDLMWEDAFKLGWVWWAESQEVESGTSEDRRRQEGRLWGQTCVWNV